MKPDKNTLYLITDTDKINIENDNIQIIHKKEIEYINKIQETMKKYLTDVLIY